MVSVIFAVLEVSFWAITTVVKLSPKFLTLISYNGISAATRNFVTSGKSHVYVCLYWPPVARVRRGFKMDLFTAICGNTFVGGTCALPSDLLVFFLLWPFLRACCLNVNEDTQCCELQKKQGWPIYIVLILITDFNPDLNQVIFVKKN